ncbi:hypothetical protein D3C75_518940 [compost metagenome]
MVTDEENTAAILHIFRHRKLLACFVGHVGFGDDVDIIIGKITQSNWSRLVEFFDIIAFLGKGIPKV